MKKVIILILPLVLLFSCKKAGEYALNENVSKEFLKQMNALDDFEAKYFADSSALAKAPSSETSIESQDALKLSESSLKAVDNLRGKSISPEAMPFYIAAIKYIEDINAQGKIANDFFTETDPMMRRGYYESIQENFKKLRNKPDSILEIQKVYFDKVGLE